MKIKMGTHNSLFSVLNSNFMSNWRRWLNTLGPVLALLVVYAIFACIAPPSFRSTRTLEMIAKHTTIVGMAALGMTLVIISGGIDLSVGSIAAMVPAGRAKALVSVRAHPGGPARHEGRPGGPPARR